MLSLNYLPTKESLDKMGKALRGQDIIIDALLGIGIKGSVRGYYKKAIKLINDSPAKVFSIDVPSGLQADTGRVGGECVKADLTTTMELPKLGCLLYPGKRYVGKLKVAPVGYPQNLVKSFQSNCQLVDEKFVTENLPKRDPYSHKSDYGRVFILAGSKGMTGAACLAANSALRSGAGLVYLGIPESLNPILETKLTEVITLPLPDSQGVLSQEALPPIVDFLDQMRIDSVALGPGLSRNKEVANLLRNLLLQIKVPLVIDADGINNLISDQKIFQKLKTDVIITPHPGELSRLINKNIVEIEAHRPQVAKQVAGEFAVNTCLKGVPTVTALPDGRLYINPTGNTGLASGGSGDVLCGLMAGLLAQGVEPAVAAPVGAYLHGLVADRLESTAGQRGMIAGDLVKALPQVLRKFESKK